MSGPRPPMKPPELPGYSFELLLGSGGYSDVFLYRQEMPRRQVAVKVLLGESLGDAGRREFDDEANTMAALSTHPFIVTIFHAAIAPGGHPFLVMEYYPRSNYSVRARSEQLSVAEVLRTGVQVASAVETAHRAGILHRDIKPANILTSEYGRPGLTDFGIASTTVGGETTEAAGMSIPWSPPEVVTGSGRSDERADVYSLAATLYTLLSGRSPFEVAGGSNRSLDLVTRIERQDVPPTGRGDVPASLERLLRQSMAKSPQDRPASAAAFARSLQEVEVEQQFSMTALEVRDDGTGDVRARGGIEDEDGTRLKSPVVIHSQAPTTTSSTTDGTVSRTHSGVTDGTVQRSGVSADGLIRGVGFVPSSPVQRVEPPRHLAGAGLDPGPVVDVAPGTANLEIDRPPAAARPPANKLVVAAGGVLLLIVALFVVRVVMLGGDSSTSTTTTSSGPVTRPVGDIVATPTSPRDVELTVGVDGLVTVSWTPVRSLPGDLYQVLDNNGDQPLADATEQTSITLPPGTAPGCVSIRVDRSNRQSDPLARNC